METKEHVSTNCSNQEINDEIKAIKQELTTSVNAIVQRLKKLELNDSQKRLLDNRVIEQNQKQGKR